MSKAPTTITLLCNALAPFAALGKPGSMDGWSGDTEKVSRADCMAAYQVLSLVEQQTADDTLPGTDVARVSEQSTQMSTEPDIVVNGMRLGPAEAMAMRVALEGFSSRLTEGLGDDHHGRFMAAAYQQSVASIRDKMYRG